MHVGDVIYLPEYCDRFDRQVRALACNYNLSLKVNNFVAVLGDPNEAHRTVRIERLS